MFGFQDSVSIRSKGLKKPGSFTVQKDVTIFQCVPCYKPGATARLIRSLRDVNCNILLDVEDSIQDIESPANTPYLKQQARIDLEQLLDGCPDQKFSLRINGVQSEEFTNDSTLPKKFGERIGSIFIPKVETAEDIGAVVSVLHFGQRISIIVETRRGVENLEQILCSSYSDKIDFVFFGNYDYHLDSDIYPVTEQYSESYWDLVKPILDRVETCGQRFGNSPYVNLADPHTLSYSMEQLNKLCQQPFGVMSLHKSQTLHFIRSTNAYEPLMSFPAYHLRSTKQYDFASGRQKGRSFSFANNRITTPQEYLLRMRRQNG